MSMWPDAKPGLPDSLVQLLESNKNFDQTQVSTVSTSYQTIVDIATLTALYDMGTLFLDKVIVTQ